MEIFPTRILYRSTIFTLFLSLLHLPLSPSRCPSLSLKFMMSSLIKIKIFLSPSLPPSLPYPSPSPSPPSHTHLLSPFYLVFMDGRWDWIIYWGTCPWRKLIHLLSEAADFLILNLWVWLCEIVLTHIDVLTVVVMTQVLFIQTYCWDCNGLQVLHKALYYRFGVCIPFQW